jgi:hypothetical protein
VPGRRRVCKIATRFATLGFGSHPRVLEADRIPRHLRSGARRHKSGARIRSQRQVSAGQTLDLPSRDLSAQAEFLPSRISIVSRAASPTRVERTFWSAIRGWVDRWRDVNSDSWEAWSPHSIVGRRDRRNSYSPSSMKLVFQNGTIRSALNPYTMSSFSAATRRCALPGSGSTYSQGRAASRRHHCR